MRAAILKQFAVPLSIEDVPVPEPGPGDVLIKVHACGVCHSDLHLAAGEWESMKPITKLPLIPGHEIVGTIERLGEGVTEFKLGDRVGVPWLYFTCGVCEFCLEGRETLCMKQQVTGCMVDGGYAEFVRAKATHTARIPDALGFAEAAPLLCAGLTVYRSANQAGLKMGQRLAVFGIGGLGHLAVQVGKAIGAEVHAVDVSEEKLALAKSLGADGGVNAANAPYKYMRSVGGAHVVMVCSGSRVAYESALRCIRRGGTLAVVGVPPETVPLAMSSMVGGEYRIMGSSVGSRQELKEVLQLAADGKLKTHVETRPLDQAAAVLEEMQAGKLLARVVLQP
ncbi:MAG: zinc-dependent alcohol dehydrogenase [Bryobacteraceae bacterium]